MLGPFFTLGVLVGVAPRRRSFLLAGVGMAAMVADQRLPLARRSKERLRHPSRSAASLIAAVGVKTDRTSLRAIRRLSDVRRRVPGSHRTTLASRSRLCRLRSWALALGAGLGRVATALSPPLAPTAARAARDWFLSRNAKGVKLIAVPSLS